MLSVYAIYTVYVITGRFDFIARVSNRKEGSYTHPLQFSVIFLNYKNTLLKHNPIILELSRILYELVLEFRLYSIIIFL